MGAEWPPAKCSPLTSPKTSLLKYGNETAKFLHYCSGPFGDGVKDGNVSCWPKVLSCWPKVSQLCFHPYLGKDHFVARFLVKLSSDMGGVADEVGATYPIVNKKSSCNSCFVLFIYWLFEIRSYWFFSTRNLIKPKKFETEWCNKVEMKNVLGNSIS